MPRPRAKQTHCVTMRCSVGVQSPAERKITTAAYRDERI
nr:MAG TPA: hypothetical protein [Caudoviricetes sp.]